MTPRPWYLDIRDWQQDTPTAEVYAWVLSQPPATVIGHLRERPELWRAVCEQIGSDKYCTVETLPLPDCFATMGTWDGGGDLAEKHNAYIEQRIADEVSATVEACAVILDRMADDSTRVFHEVVSQRRDSPRAKALRAGAAAIRVR